HAVLGGKKVSISVRNGDGALPIVNRGTVRCDDLSICVVRHGHVIAAVVRGMGGSAADSTAVAVIWVILGPHAECAGSPIVIKEDEVAVIVIKARPNITLYREVRPLKVPARYVSESRNETPTPIVGMPDVTGRALIPDSPNVAIVDKFAEEVFTATLE